MKPTVYLETSIIGYVTSRPSRDLVTAANQQLTIDWWDNRRGRYDLLTWNCAHIANAALQARIQAIIRAAGLEPPTICTPQQLMEA